MKKTLSIIMVFCLLLSCTVFVNAQSGNAKIKDLEEINKRKLEKMYIEDKLKLNEKNNKTDEYDTSEYIQKLLKLRERILSNKNKSTPTIDSDRSYINNINTLSTSSYDRDDAVEYALDYNGSEYGLTSTEGYNDSVYPIFKDADCANFVSQCLKAGGMEEVRSSRSNAWEKADNWFCDSTDESDLEEISLTWRHTNSFMTYWKNNCDEYTIYDVSDTNSWSEFHNTLWDDCLKGDVIQFCDEDGDPWHTVIVTAYDFDSGDEDDILYSAHSYNRENASLYDVVKNLPNSDKVIVYDMK
ncbi:amidase domain-containing protein [Paramaledivibacter caminithermalis]|jgi:hypothetical protein|uniref:Putative amidase domain-containing protein n=1 Tax=Paramaledivibacter caminithermalis (strain DSM 15212 / CIP 107654 / DViRD3) TaxID=1121301 RepID=A0A1M6NDS9_PARC5|nr:amidase domain-containing protein [Paramaledivibacter caminithermalis]SHJ93764.1 Putative amidase domain-containing protein [Paramaledivibacter caminithermalis DSM 15212]